MQRDVVIVGGGPAGSSLAWGLRGSGLSVLILDRSGFPRDKTCAGWVTPPVLEALEIDADLYAKEGLTLQPIHGFRVARAGDRASAFREPRPISFGIRRCEFDHFLLTRCGAELRLRESLRSLERCGERWIVNGDLEARLLVGAGGHFCPVARLLSPGLREPVIAAQEIEFPLESAEEGLPVDPEVPELYFERDLRGYGWVFRKGRYLNVGLGRRSDGGALADHARRFTARLRAGGKLPAALPSRWRGHAYLLHGETRRPLCGKGVALLGDAAGLAYPKSGEGIRPAVESGLLLARALRTESDIDAALATYERLMLARFGARQRARSPLDLVPAALLGPLAGLLFATPLFSRRVVVDRWFSRRGVAPLSSFQLP